MFKQPTWLAATLTTERAGNKLAVRLLLKVLMLNLILIKGLIL